MSSVFCKKKKKQGQTRGRGLTDPNSLDLFLFGPDP
jgi:hypothetical protein